MSGTEKEGFLPSYEESVNTTSTGLSQFRSPHRGQQLLDNLTLARSQHIRSVTETHIIPFVEQQALYGISKTTIAMIPSDISLPAVPEKSDFSFETGNHKDVEVIGFSSEEEPQIVRLEGQMNRTEFWKPQSIVLELERVLRESLNASPHIRPPSPREAVPQQAKKTRKGVFGRIAKAMDDRSSKGKVEVEEPKNEAAGQVLVRVRLEEVSLRTLSEFGLYDTMAKPCIIIRVDAGC